MPKIPTVMQEIRSLLKSLDWEAMRDEISREAEARVVIIGPVNSGKSTLFNLLQGREVSRVSALPGTTRELVTEELGPITLIDTPGFGEVSGVERAQIALSGVERADVVVLLLDAAAGIRQADFSLFQQVHLTGKPVIVALNKIDLVKRDLALIRDDLAHKLGVPVVPICARNGRNVATMLMPRVVDAHPPLAVALGRELPAYRRQAAHRAIRNAAGTSALVGAEPIPGGDIPFLIANQVRLVLRIAAIYGEPMTADHARELVATIATGVFLRYLAQAAAKALPGPGWAISGGIAGAGTWAIGQVAVEYFESGKQLSPAQLQSLYRRLTRKGGAALPGPGLEGRGDA
ncbi:MAG: GTP-binding protein [Chloroflexi bacterium]|nr:GTP-binding protein [Chloroflexota bacterium]